MLRTLHIVLAVAVVRRTVLRRIIRQVDKADISAEKGACIVQGGRILRLLLLHAAHVLHLIGERRLGFLFKMHRQGQVEDDAEGYEQ